VIQKLRRALLAVSVLVGLGVWAVHGQGPQVIVGRLNLATSGSALSGGCLLNQLGLNTGANGLYVCPAGSWAGAIAPGMSGAGGVSVGSTGVISGCSLTYFTPNIATTTTALAPSAANAIRVSPIYIPCSISLTNIMVIVGTLDAGNNYSWGLYTQAGTAVCTTTAAVISGTGNKDGACSQGTVTVNAGGYVFGWTGAATTATIDYGVTSASIPWTSALSSTSASSGQIPSTSIAIPTVGLSTSTYGAPILEFH
jgi:hypothetical protein